MSPTSTQQHRINGNLLPLRFALHSFSAYAFNTLKCRVIYGNADQTPESADKPSGPPPANYHSFFGSSSQIGIRNFPGPVEVSWTSLDGVSHRTSIDLNQIFPNEEVLHRVPEEEIPDNMYSQGLYLDPEIIVEVNDRTISIYMRALIPMKHRQNPADPYSDARNDLIRAWTHTY